MQKLIQGVAKFKASSFEERKMLFAELARGQNPEALFITCSDSRIDPCLMTQAEPGELFVIRNAGNIVPPHVKSAGGVTGSVEYAVAVLGVKHIVVCGHTNCGAMNGALNPESIAELPHVSDWLENTRAAVEVAKAHARAGESAADLLARTTQENVLLQLQHLKTHPVVLSRLSVSALELHGWVYDIEHGDVLAYDRHTETFVPLEQCYQHLL